jgi:ankyrin repeat protein
MMRRFLLSLAVITASGAALAAPPTPNSNTNSTSESFNARLLPATPQNFVAAAQNGDLAELKRILSKNPKLLETQGAAALRGAVYARTTTVAAFLLDRGIPVDAPGAQGETPLRNLVFSRETASTLAMLELLVARGADVNRRDSLGNAPLHLALAQRNQKLAQFLAQHGAIDATTPVFEALSCGDAAMLRAALQKQPRLANQVRDDGDLGRTHLILTERLTPLHAAVIWNRPEMVQILLENRADAGARDADGYLPLHLAAWRNQLEIARLLLDAGADVNARQTAGTVSFRRPQEEGLTPLHFAASAGSLEVAELLLQRGALVDAQTSRGGLRGRTPSKEPGRTPLQFAVVAGNAPLVKLLLSRGAKARGPLSDDAPLLSAIPVDSWFGSPPAASITAIVDALLRAGANPNARDAAKTYSNPSGAVLFRAIGRHDLTLVTLLLDAGAKLDASNSNGMAPLQFALGLNRSNDAHVAAIAHLLLARGANVNARDSKGRTPLFAAVKNLDLEMTRELLNRGADAKARDAAGVTPLSLAFDAHNEAGNAKIIALLRERGAQNPKLSFFEAIAAGDTKTVGELLKTSPHLIKTFSSDEQTPLSHAMRHNQSAMVALLLSRGADVEARSWGEPALFAAVNTQNAALVGLILRHGAQINERSDEGYSVLFRAIGMGESDRASDPKASSAALVSLLLRAGADANLRDKWERTPLHTSVQSQAPRLADLAVMDALLRAGANPNARDRSGQTPLHLAAQHGQLLAAKRLLEHGARADLLDKQRKTAQQLAPRGDAAMVALLRPVSR